MRWNYFNNNVGTNIILVRSQTKVADVIYNRQATFKWEWVNGRVARQTDDR